MSIADSGEITGANRVVITLFLCAVSSIIVLTVPFWIEYGPVSWLIPFTIMIMLILGVAYMIAKGGRTAIVKDGTRRGYAMVVYFDEGVDLQQSKYRIPERCTGCGADLTHTSLELAHNLRVRCSECNEELPCSQSYGTGYGMEG